MKGKCMKMYRTFLPLILLAAAVSAGATAQDMRENTMRSLFADQKASHVGDAITIMVVETNSASNDASTNSSRESNLGLSGSTGSASGRQTASRDRGGLRAKGPSRRS